MRTIPWLIVPFLLLSSCQPLHQRQATFNEAEYAPYETMGTASISGQAFMKTRGGDVKYGAGNPVGLNPVTSYSTEWYEVGIKGGSSLSEADPRAAKYFKTVTADGEGRFTFSDLPPGDYYIACRITWYVDAYSQTGGYVHAKVSVKDGESKKNVILGW